MNELSAQLQAYLQREHDRLERVRVLESEIAALKSANERLHQQVLALQSLPLVGATQRLSQRLNDYPALKATLKRLLKRGG